MAFVHFTSERSIIEVAQESKAVQERGYIIKVHDVDCTIYISGFPSNYSEEDIEDFIAEKVGVSVQELIFDMGHYAFISLCSPEDALKTVHALHGQNIHDHCYIICQLADGRGLPYHRDIGLVLHEMSLNHKRDGSLPYVRRPEVFSELERTIRTIYVGKIPQDITKNDIYKIFTKGASDMNSLVEEVTLPVFESYCFVVFTNHVAARKALSTST